MKAKDILTVTVIALGLFLLGLLIGIRTQAYPTTPSDWWCEGGYPMLQEGWQYCRPTGASHE